MHIASKHLQSSLIAGLITVCGLTIGFAGAENAAVPSFVSTFKLISPNTITEGPFAGAKFDIGGYISHPCYQIAGTEATSCREQYGLTEPLKTYLDNGSLIAYLRAHGLATGSAAAVSSSSSSVSSAASSVSSAASSVSSVETQPVEASKPTTTPRITTSVLNSTVVTLDDFDQLRQNRSNELWAFCSDEFDTRYEVAACFQRNINILMRLNITIEGNVQ